MWGMSPVTLFAVLKISYLRPLVDGTKQTRPIAGSIVSSIERGQAAPNINEDVGQTTMTTIPSPIRSDFDHVEVEAAGWFDDPEGRHHLRYFNGDSWTSHVTHFGPTPCVSCRVDG